MLICGSMTESATEKVTDGLFHDIAADF